MIDNPIIEKYRSIVVENLLRNFPTVTTDELKHVVDYIISKRYKEVKCVLTNNYLNQEIETTVNDITKYIHEKKPIMVANGCLFKPYTKEFTPLYKLITSFTENRSKYKKEMFKYAKGTDKFNKYNMLQMLAKRDNNAIYGTIGSSSSALYNIYLATGITRTGRALISHAITFFESFFTNNVKFHSINECITFIDRVSKEPLVYNIQLDNHISREDVFFKLLSSFESELMVSDDELEIIWSIILQLPQVTLDKLFYKNNMLQFCDNKYIKDIVGTALKKLDEPFIDPNDCPEVIREDLDYLFEVFKEWCYMRYIVVDKIDRSATMNRDISIITDTDSTMPCFNGWYEFVKNEILPDIKDDIKIMKNLDIQPVYEEDRIYNFKTRQIETKTIDVSITKETDGVRFSIINILSYIAGRLLREHFDLVSENYNTKSDYKKCLIAMKNEFLFGRALITGGKKNYASKQELQEGNVIPEHKMLDIKGLPINKTSVNESSRKAMQDVLFKKILNTEKIDQLDIIQSLARIEYDIKTSIESGNKEYFKPVTIKAMYSYDIPLRIQGIKASVAYNALKEDNEEPLDLEKRNAIDIAKVAINKHTIPKVKESNPGLYNRIIKFFEDYPEYKNEITSIAIPLDIKVPKWILDFIDYSTIVNDNIKVFPLESVGITRFEQDNINYTNVLKL